MEITASIARIQDLNTYNLTSFAFCTVQVHNYPQLQLTREWSTKKLQWGHFAHCTIDLILNREMRDKF